MLTWSCPIMGVAPNHAKYRQFGSVLIVASQYSG